MLEALGGLAAALAIIATGIKAIGWGRRKLSQRKARKTPAHRPYPVRLTCTDASEFHPSSGYHEGFHIEVFNDSDQPVTLKGFGLDLTMRSQDEWHRYETTIQHPRQTFPARLEPNDGLDGYVDTEVLADRIYADGEDKYWVATHAYVDVTGYGQKRADL